MLADLFAMMPPWPELIAAVAIVFVGGFLRGFTGFGGALAIIPVLALIFTPKEAVAMHIVMEVPGLFQLLPIAARDCDRSTVLPAILAIIVGTPVGVYILTSLDPQPMRIAISVFVLVMVILLARNWRYPGRIGSGVMAGVGAVGGIIQGGTGIGGPPIVAVLMSRRDDDDTTRGNILGLMGTLVIVAIPLQTYFGVLTLKALVWGAFAGIVYVSATYAGSRYYVLGGKRIYRMAAISVLGAVALFSLISSLT